MKKRADLIARDALAAIGWEAVTHVTDRDKPVPHFALSFKNGDIRVWFVGRKWIRAKLEATNYTGHTQHPDLASAIGVDPKSIGLA